MGILLTNALGQTNRDFLEATSSPQQLPGCPLVRTPSGQSRFGESIRHYNVVMSPAHDSLLYARVETVLAGEITNGGLKVGDQLPTEDSLIARFGVSRITVRRAIQNLV